MVRALVADGAHVVVADIDVDAAQAVVDSLPGAGTGSVAGARAARLNVTDAAAVAALVEEVIGEHGGLDLMFANAGITWGGDTELLTLEQWNAIIDVNVRGVVHCVHAAYPHMIARGSGSLVLTSSMGGLSPAGLLTSYAMTKHAVVGLGMSLRAEAAGHGVGVTHRTGVNEVHVRTSSIYVGTERTAVADFEKAQFVSELCVTSKPTVCLVPKHLCTKFCEVTLRVD